MLPNLIGDRHSTPLRGKPCSRIGKRWWSRFNKRTVDWDTRLVYRRYLWSLGFAVAEARAGVEAAGYAGPIKVEIFNQAIWNTQGDAVLVRMRETPLAYM